MSAAGNPDGARASPGGWGLDFGATNTVLARHDTATGAATVVAVPGHGQPASDDGHEVSTVPSVIHYADDGRRLVGQEVLAADLLDAAGTVRWMTSSIGQRSSGAVQVGEHRISHAEAGGDFLAAVLGAVLPARPVLPGGEGGSGGEAASGEVGQVALAVPVEAFEHDEAWLRQVAEASALPRVRLVDEPSAAAVGYGLRPRPGQVLLLVDCGAGSVRAAVVRVPDVGQPADGGPADRGSTPIGGRPCRVLGQARDDVGGATIDGWLFAEVLDRHGLGEDHRDDRAVRAFRQELLRACERAKHELTDAERATIAVTHPETGAVLDLDLVRCRGERSDGRSSGAGEESTVSFENLLDRHDLFARLDRVVRRALRGASERGYGVDDVAEVLVVGGTSLVPSVRRTIERIVGRGRMYSDRPRDAVARGAAAVAAGVGLADQVQHDYALRCYNRARGRYEFRTCVAAGTPYPTEEPVATVILKASHDGQRELGVAVFELGETGGDERSELVLDPSGSWRLEALAPADEQSRTHLWVNERSPTYLVADPPARAGEARFRIELGVDADKRLVLTAHDLVSRDTVLRDHPVVELR